MKFALHNTTLVHTCLEADKEIFLGQEMKVALHDITLVAIWAIKATTYCVLRRFISKFHKGIFPNLCSIIQTLYVIWIEFNNS